MLAWNPSWNSDKSRYFVRRFLFLILALVLIAWPVPAPVRALSQVAPRIGAVEAFFRPGDAAEAGVGFERIIFEWRDLQPNGPRDWDTSHIPDEWLNDAR